LADKDVAGHQAKIQTLHSGCGTPAKAANSKVAISCQMVISILAELHTLF